MTKSQKYYSKNKYIEYIQSMTICICRKPSTVCFLEISNLTIHVYWLVRSEIWYTCVTPWNTQKVIHEKSGEHLILKHPVHIFD